MTQPTECPVCDNTAITVWSVARDYEYFSTKDTYTYYYCVDCKSIFLHPLPVDHLTTIYPPNYYSFVGTKRNIVTKAKEYLDNCYRVTAVAETLAKTALNTWTIGSAINLERSLLPSSRLDGHFVQGHVDTVGICESIKDKGGSWEMRFSFPKSFAPLIIEKGSICLNGISLTVFNVKKKSFSVAIIPYTFDHTNLQHLKAGEAVNLEFDLIGKYLLRKTML